MPKIGRGVLECSLLRSISFNLADLAAHAALPHLATPLAAVTTAAALSECLDSEGRVRLLQSLKEHGVDKIGERQALANALGKARREGMHPAAAESPAADAAAATSRRPRVGLVHGGCSNPWIFRQQLKPLLEALGGEVELVDLQGGLHSEEVRFDDRGRQQMALLHKVFGDDQVLREHAVTCCDESGRFFYGACCLTHGSACCAHNPIPSGVLASPCCRRSAP